MQKGEHFFIQKIGKEKSIQIAFLFLSAFACCLHRSSLLPRSSLRHHQKLQIRTVQFKPPNPKQNEKTLISCHFKLN